MSRPSRGNHRKPTENHGFSNGALPSTPRHSASAMGTTSSVAARPEWDDPSVPMWVAWAELQGGFRWRLQLHEFGVSLAAADSKVWSLEECFYAYFLKLITLGRDLLQLGFGSRPSLAP